MGRIHQRDSSGLIVYAARAVRHVTVRVAYRLEWYIGSPGGDDESFFARGRPAARAALARSTEPHENVVH